MTAYDRLRSLQQSVYGLAAAAPSDVAELLTDYAALMLDNETEKHLSFRAQLAECERERDALRAELDAIRKQEPVAFAYRFDLPKRHDDAHDNDEYSEVVFRTRRELSPDDPFGRRGRDFDDAADTTEVPLYAAPVPAQPAVPEGYTPVRTEVLLWLLGENGDFECPPAQYFRGKPAPYFWRKRLRESMLSAPVPAHPAVPDDVARDAARYRWLREHSQTGSVKTLLPLERCHYVVVHESAYEYQSFDDAIDAAIISATEGRKDE